MERKDIPGERTEALRALALQLKRLYEEYGTDEGFAHNMAVHLVNALTLSLGMYESTRKKFPDALPSKSDELFVAIAHALFSERFNKPIFEDFGADVSRLSRTAKDDDHPMYG